MGNINDKYEDIEGRREELTNKGNTLVDRSIKRSFREWLDSENYEYKMVEYNDDLTYFSIE